MARKHITLEEFLESERKKLVEFEAWWRVKAVEEPQHYPMKMGGGDWAEQLDIFEPKPSSED